MNRTLPSNLCFGEAGIILVCVRAGIYPSNILEIVLIACYHILLRYSRMRAAAILLSCVGFGLLATLPSAAEVSEIGKVTRLIPRADLTRSAKTQRLQPNDPVVENDRVRTSSGGRARLALDGGSIVNVGSASELVVHLPAGSTQVSTLELRYGQIRAWVVEQTGAEVFQIRTNTAVLGVLGTTLFVDASRDLTRVANLSTEPASQVRVRSTDPTVTDEVILLPGEGTSVPTNRPPQPPRRWTQEEMQAGYEETDIP
ncbi:MAG: FecR domain-containing protein [Acidobacteria bacterium]|nr:FecR domain-containing protein [Acidobacteriota bacterium]